MNRQLIWACAQRFAVNGGVVSLFLSALATLADANPWAPMTSATPGPSVIVPTAKEVPGKDFSDIRDYEAPGGADAEQVLAWDGLGGVRDSFDYSASRVAYPDVLPDGAVDGIASAGDALFHAVRDNQAALLFSVETDPTILFERATGFPAAPAGFGVWATAADIDAMNLPLDTDGLEVWGGDSNDDSDRYSLAGDPFSDFVVPAESRKVAIWAYDPAANISVHHTLTTDLAAAIDLQYGGIGYNGPLWGQLVEQMDVDAIMTFGKQVTFSIRPLDLTDPLLPDFDGGEIFVYDGPASPTKFLDHGGHLWDTAFDVRGAFLVNHENIDAIEAVAQFVPEPGSFALLLVGLIVAGGYRRQR
jgi:hypothetical protein